MENVLKYIALVLDIVPRLVATGINIKAFIAQQKAVIASWGPGGVPTDAQWAELNAMNASLGEQLHSDDK